MNELLLTLFGSLLGYAGKHYLGSKWGKIAKTATSIVRDASNPTTDPKQAVIEAMIEHNLSRIAEEAQKVADTLAKAAK